MGTQLPQLAEQLSLALQTLNSNTSREQKQQASSSLEGFQKSVLLPYLTIFFIYFGLMRNLCIKNESWPVVLGLLQRSSTAGIDVKIFAAQTLRSKARLSTIKNSNLIYRLNMTFTSCHNTLVRALKMSYWIYCSYIREGPVLL